MSGPTTKEGEPALGAASPSDVFGFMFTLDLPGPCAFFAALSAFFFAGSSS